MKSFHIALLLIALFEITQSQTTLTIKIKDLKKHSIGGAIVKYNNTSFITNDSGSTSIKNYKNGFKINIYKLGFVDTVLFFSGKEDKLNEFLVTVFLRLKPIVLPEVAVFSSAKKELNPMKADFILDYELNNDTLIELLSNYILFINQADDKIYKTKTLNSSTKLAKDVYSNNYTMDEKNAFKITYNISPFKVNSTAVDYSKLKWSLQYCEVVTNSFTIIRRYKDNNQTIAFFAISNLNKQKAVLLKEITNEERVNAVAAFANETNELIIYLDSKGINAGSAANGEELELVRRADRMSHMLERHYVLPSYMFLKLVNENVYLFAHDIDTMFVYNKNLELVKSKRIAYHHLKIWGKELIVNEEKTKVYAKLVNNSKTTLTEVDLQTGELMPKSTAIEASFPYKIKVYKNFIYYMDKEENNRGRSVFRQSLNASN